MSKSLPAKNVLPINRIKLLKSEQCSPMFIIQCALYEVTGNTFWTVHIDHDEVKGYVTRLHVVAYWQSGSSWSGGMPKSETYKVIVFTIDDYSDYSQDFFKQVVKKLRNEALAGNVKQYIPGTKHELLEKLLREQGAEIKACMLKND